MLKGFLQVKDHSELEGEAEQVEEKPEQEEQEKLPESSKYTKFIQELKVFNLQLVECFPANMIEAHFKNHLLL